MVLSHVMRGRPSCLLQSAVGGGGGNRILLASALSSMRIICPNKVSRRDWIIVGLAVFIVYHFMFFCRPGTRNNLPFLNAKPNSNSTKNRKSSLYICQIRMWGKLGFWQHSNSNLNSVTPQHLSIVLFAYDHNFCMYNYM